MYDEPQREPTMPMTEQERREYREDLGRIFDGIDGIRGDIRGMRGEIGHKVSEATLERKLAEHFALCRGREATGVVSVPAAAGHQAPVEVPAVFLTPLIKTALWVGAVIGSALAGFLASGGTP